MHPIHDADAILILALMMSSKRRPADLVEIMAAADLVQGPEPADLRLSESFSRLSVRGLVCQEAGGFTLAADAQAIVAALPKKADNEERVFRIKEALYEYIPRGEHVAIRLTAEQLHTALVTHRSAAKSTVKNLLVPKPKPVESTKRPLQRRKPAPGKRRG